MKNLTYKSILKFVVTLLIFCAFNNIKTNVPFGVALLIPFVSAGISPVIIFFSFALSALFCFTLNNALLLLICTFLPCLICVLYRHKKCAIRFESCIYTFVSLTPFMLGNFGIEIYQKLAYSAIIALFCPIFKLGIDFVYIKKFNIKGELEELLSLCILTVAFIYGLVNFSSLWLVYALCVFSLLLFCYFYKNARAFFCAILLACPIALYTKELEIIALFSIYSAVCLLFIKKSKLLSAILVVLTQTCYAFISGALLTFDVNLLISYFLPFALFLFFPTRLLLHIERIFKRFSEPIISREIINSERAEISNKLYNLSTVFLALNQTILQFRPLILDKQALIDKMCDQIIFNLCDNCYYRDKCLAKNKPSRDDLEKLLSIGTNKGKVSLIDLSRDFSNYCYCTNNMIFEVNRLLGEYEDALKTRSQTESTMHLVALESSGIGEVLKQMAFDFSDKFIFDRKFELDIFNFLCKNGIVAVQIMALGDNLHLVLNECNIDFIFVAELLSKKLGKKMRIFKKISLGKSILAVFTPSPTFDACFGVAQRTKFGSSKSGDTHSLTRIDGNNFIAAICDGMGSGETAYKNSQTAISLVEAFLKTQLDKNISIDLINRMLSLCAEDSFCALDLAIIDLCNAKADIIKIGATFGAHITGDEIKIIENNALPLGILQEISPTLVKLNLLDGDMIVLLSDGVTDAFFSSADTIDFLYREKCANPQTLADKLIDFAFDCNDGKANDDMTAVVIKIFKTS